MFIITAMRSWHTFVVDKKSGEAEEKRIEKEKEHGVAEDKDS